MLPEVWRQNSRDSPIRWFETESNAVAEECQSSKCGFASTSLIQSCTQDWVKFSPHSHTYTLSPPLPPDRDTKWSDPCSLHMQRTAYWCFQSRLLIFTSTGRGVRVCGRCNVYRSWCRTWVKGPVSLGYHSGGFLPMLSKSLHPPRTHPLLINSSLVCFFTQQ